MQRVLLSIALSLFLSAVFSVGYAMEYVGGQSQSAEKSSQFTFPVQGKVNATQVNLRREPDVGSPIMGRIRGRDSSLWVVAQQDDWYQVRIGKRLAWIYSRFVTLSQDGQQSSVSDSRESVSMVSSDGTVPALAASGAGKQDPEAFGGIDAIAETEVKTSRRRRSVEPGRAYYDFGVFAYEDEDYDDAESNFLKALSFDAENAFYNHFLGKTYQKMKRHLEAMRYFAQAWETDSTLSGLRYDLAFQHYQMSNYDIAADLFRQTVEEDPANVLAHYYTGISNFKLKRYDIALKFFFDAIEKSPSIKVNGFYYAGICYRKMGDIDKAVEHFEFVRDHADSGALITSSKKWLEEIEAYRIAKRPLSLYAKVGYGYDNNVRLEPLDADIYADEDDYGAIGYFSGRYNVVNRDNLRVGLGYSHYQTIHHRLKTYDLIGSVGNFHVKYQASPFALGFSYFPSLYWLDGQTFMRRQEFRPEVTIKLSDGLSTRLSYGYYDIDHVQDNGRDGHTNEFALDAFNSITGKELLIYGGIGYEMYYPSDPDQDYRQTKAKLGMSVALAWGLNLNVTGRYYYKRYENPDSLFNITRRDHKYSGAVSFSRDLIYGWLSIIVDYNYTRNDSSIMVFDYQRQMVTLSLAAKY